MCVCPIATIRTRAPSTEVATPLPRALRDFEPKVCLPLQSNPERLFAQYFTAWLQPVDQNYPGILFLFLRVDDGNLRPQ